MQCTCGDPDCEMEMWVGENYVLIEGSRVSALAYFNAETGEKLIAELQKSVEAIKQHNQQAK